MRVLVRLPNWIGDAVMALPAVLALGESHPDWEWWLLARPKIRPLFTGLDEPFRLMPWPRADRPGSPRDLAELVRELRVPRFDGVLVLPPSIRVALEALASRAPVRVGWNTEGRGRLLTARLTATRDRPLREQYADLAQLLLAELEGGDLVLAEELPLPARRTPLRAEEIAEAAVYLERAGLSPDRTIALAPGAAYGPTKRWPEDRFAELGRQLRAEGWTPLWFGGPEERALCARLAEAVGGVSVAGGRTLRQSLALLARLRAMVSNDSGAMHLAQAAGCPVLGIFGSTSAEWTGPAGDARVVAGKAPCAPCFAMSCPTELECLTGVSVESVHEGLMGLVQETSWRAGRPAAFLDRDGTVIEEVNYLTDPAQVRLLPGAVRAMQELERAGYALVVITNQSAIARGLLDRPGLHAIHLRLWELLAAEGIRLTGIEFCPHHPDFGSTCACRKPAPGMLFRAAHRHALDLARSVLIGDTLADLEAGRQAGCASLLVRTGHGEETVRALAAAGDQRWPVFADLGAAVSGWLEETEPPRV